MMDVPLDFDFLDCQGWVEPDLDSICPSQFQAVENWSFSAAPSWNTSYPDPVTRPEAESSDGSNSSPNNSQDFQESNLSLPEVPSTSHGCSRRRSSSGAVMERQRKNAISARKNRLKQKEKMSLLNDRLDKLRGDKKKLQGENSSLEERIDRLQDELLQLKMNLMNGSQLSPVLTNLASGDQ